MLLYVTTMTSNFSIFVIILNYKRYGDTKRCLGSIFASDLPKESIVLVVDNSQVGQEQNELKKKFHSITLIPNKKNVGFATGNNIGIQYALKQGATHILIVNPDTVIPKTFFAPLLSTIHSNPNTGIVAPALKHRQKNEIFYGLDGSIDWRTGKPTHVNVISIKDTSTIKAEFVSFACVLIAASVFAKIGLIDEGYFMYLEDVDFCLRARQANFRVYLNPTVVVEHKTSSSFRRPTDKLFYSFPSHLYFITKWMAFPQKIFAILYICLFYPYLYLLWTIHGLKMYRFK